MLKIANKKNLKQYASQLLGKEDDTMFGKPGPKAQKLIEVCLKGFERTYGHISHDEAAHLAKIDKILGTYGVEGVLEGKLDFQYCNAGDTYALTILYWKGKLYIGDWGTIVENNS